ncbi:hypothetical protein B7P43_G06787 [Cryptotermes secundus]|uniref:Uncharacterized protein n=1 Tax=Cryptotermes secundus TaxID=105785 RepID=A0A2J7PD95_9NEOP|nr:hypothetical protein B7P43_G06787 [Cryptotermes secundus]
MASPQQKAFCVLEFAKTNSVFTVQRAFRRRFGINPPCPKNIRRWFRQFQESGCLCKGKSPGRPRVSEEQVARIRAAFERSPRKSTNRASRELAIPQSTVWRVLTVRLHLKPYRLQLVQALTNDDKRKRMEFCDSMLEMMEDETFISRLIFSEHERDSPKVNVFRAVSQDKDMLGFLTLSIVLVFKITNKNTTFRKLDLFPSSGEGKLLFNLALCAWPARSPDLTVCDFFLWGYVKDHVYVPPLPTNLDDLKHRITTAINSVHRDMLIRAWEEFSYRIDVARAAGGGHIEHL